ncbi:hypothetical protein [Streptomyces indicus]|uniref:Uncharacterized protein n=1 Tax=Streptomyces indicus TaxID=417292 RepID=A0A1G9BGS9_9ACTN|nr:hypothetical protein [Streptomyces indicus]SDK38719.1 hypothetical protein SAMN05421806_10751 [Streptomyces indicus]
MSNDQSPPHQPNPYQQPPQQNPYATAPQGPAPYPAQPQASYAGQPQAPHPAQPGQPHPYGAPAPYPYPYGGYQAGPPQMPGSVKAARVLVFVLAGFFVLALVAVAALGGGPEEFGAVFGYNLMVITLFILALRFTTAGNGVRVAAIVLASVHILLALGSMANGNGLGGLIAAGLAIALVAVLSQSSAGHWFKRPRTAEQFPQGYAAS